MRLLSAVLRNADLARIELGWAMVTLVRWALAILVSLYAYRAGGATAVGLAAVARIAPAAVLAPQLALLADRHSRRQVLIWSLLARLVVTTAMAFAVAESASVTLVVGLAAVWAVADVVHKPAQLGLLTATARNPGELAAANALWAMVDNAGFLCAGLLVALMVSTWGLAAAFAGCVLPLFIGYLALQWVTRDRGLGATVGTSTAKELAAGLRAIRHDRDLRTTVGLRTADFFTQSILDVLLVVVALGVLSMGEQGAGWLSACWGVGGILGGLLATFLVAGRRLADGVRWGLVLAGVPVVIVGIWPEPGIAVVNLVIVGVGFGLIDAALLTLSQRLVAADVMARVFAVEEVLCVVAMALGSLVASLLVTVLDEQGALVCAGLILPVIAVLRWVRLRRFDSGAEVDAGVFSLLRGVPAFANLPVSNVETLTLRSSTVGLPVGADIITQGRPGDDFFVIGAGQVEVWESGEFRRVEYPGEYFGEIALLRDVPRTATVKAATDVSLVVIARAEFLAAVGAHVRTRTDLEAVADQRLEGTP